jgi:hypothetical protein
MTTSWAMALIDATTTRQEAGGRREEGGELGAARLPGPPEPAAPQVPGAECGVSGQLAAVADRRGQAAAGHLLRAEFPRQRLVEAGDVTRRDVELAAKDRRQREREVAPHADFDDDLRPLRGEGLHQGMAGCRGPHTSTRNGGIGSSRTLVSAALRGSEQLNPCVDPSTRAATSDPPRVRRTGARRGGGY